MSTSRTTRPELLFVSTRFLFPVDSGGKIRTTQILRGLKGGRFRIRLLSPGTADLVRRHARDLETVCDDFDFWPAPGNGVLRLMARAAYLLSALPMPVRSDLSVAAKRKVRTCLAARPAVAVFDFLHSVVLAPPLLQVPSVLFTHNIETEIFARHRDTTENRLMQAMWASQTRKMAAFERAALSRFDVVVAVSDRDADMFARDFDCRHTFVIPTGVDTEYFRHHAPMGGSQIVFIGSMDWLANQDAMRFFMDDVWPRIAAEVPDARMKVIGRKPPEGLVREAQRRGLPWQFTGFVDDVREHVQGADISVIPMRIAGGTRLKVYEAMAMGPVVVSTAIGVEGLPVVDATQCRIADDPVAFADAVVTLLRDPGRLQAMSRAARKFVERSCGYRTAASRFADACVQAIDKERT